MGRGALIVVVAGVVVLLVVTSFYGLAALGVLPGEVFGILRVSGKAMPVPGAFWGENVLARFGLGESTTQALSDLSATPINYLRYPGGLEGERMDMAKNILYTYGSGTVAPTLSVSGFASFCQEARCHAIVELPMEIDNPAQDALEASYVVNTVGFQPDYWELGNEPGNYPCWGVAWSNWQSQTGCSGGPTASAFTALTTKVIAAVRGVDPGARFIGLGGVDSSSWITTMEAANGHDLAAVAVHTYPDGNGPAVGTVSGYMSGLAGQSESLPTLLASARAAVLAGCSTCGTQVFVTEMGAATAKGSYAQYIGSFYDALFLAGQVAEGLNFQAANLDEFCWGCTTYDTLGTPKYTFYTQFASKLGPDEVNATVAGAAGVYAGATDGNGATELLLVNANSAAASVGLNGSGLPVAAAASLYSWTSSESEPVKSSVATTDSLTLAPYSMALVVASGSANGTPFNSPIPLPPFTEWEIDGVPLAWILSFALMAVGAAVVALLPGKPRYAGLLLLLGGGAVAVVLWLYGVAP